MDTHLQGEQQTTSDDVLITSTEELMLILEDFGKYSSPKYYPNFYPIIFTFLHFAGGQIDCCAKDDFSQYLISIRRIDNRDIALLLYGKKEFPLPLADIKYISFIIYEIGIGNLKHARTLFSVNNDGECKFFSSSDQGEVGNYLDRVYRVYANNKVEFGVLK